ncbi:hypothetical protein A2111_00905 [Candidatus Daviesbacteria bacterium GWA1_38_6]|nr:MAG: hypothetical protein A2111_00905 [Candidatus Daviesbacteria bacterium GWA1_38_6]
MSKRFKIVFFVRFLGYLLFFTGLLSFVLVLGPLTKVEFEYRLDRLRGVKRTIPKIITSDAGSEALRSEQGQPIEVPTGGFGELKSAGSVITPVSTEFGIVIEKINANAKVVPNVSPADEKEYVKALSEGVAHAKGTNFPGEPGNIYLFSHSTDAPWNIVRFNAIFYLLREVESGDRIIMFYKNRRYDYIVYDKTVAKPLDTHFLTDKYNTSVLTLQTCDPPGTLLNRLIVRARLEGS